ncbi:MFS transporter [Acidisphaera sp. L21]|uniref:MFS transporter n=1 Tax=Acidisphaera sp. L21 TaxID=1641851 RepID=UPI00131A8043|nr:MFS transporter [Acidisphaera sp. L21]
MRLPLLALAVAAFGIGTTEFVIMGLLPEVAQTLAVTIPQAGLLVTGYALAVAFGSPLVAIATARLPRRQTLLGLMGIFIVGNTLCALAPNYWSLMGARVVTALAHGAFFGIGSVVATQVVPRNQRAQAIALMFMGLTLANVTGVPLGTLLGQAFGWRATFWAVSLIGVAAVAALWVWVPAMPVDRSANLLAEFRTLRRPQVLLAMGMSVLSSVSLFTAFTYITPLLETVTGLSAHAVSLVLLVFGAGLTIGNLVGGRLADWRLMPAVLALFALLVVVLLGFYVASPMPIPAIAVMVVWGATTFAIASPLQMRVVDQAVDGPNLAATLNQGAFNLGNATGAWIGAMAISAGWSYRDLPLLGALVAMLGFGVTALSYILERRAAWSEAGAAARG